MKRMSASCRKGENFSQKNGGFLVKSCESSTNVTGLMGTSGVAKMDI